MHILIIPAAVIILLLLRLLSLRCRRGHAILPVLRQYRYAHRGLYDGEAPENSLSAFRRAVRLGYGAELDLHLTRDGRLAVMHDDNIARMCGTDRKISQSDSADLADCRLAGTDEKIPYFEEVLEIFQGRTPLIIELKTDRGNAAALCQAAMDLLDHYSGPYCVESFDPRAVLWFRRHRPEICRGQLCENYRKTLKGPARYAAWILGSSLVTNLLTQPDFIAFRFSDRHALSLRLCRRLYDVCTVYWTLQSLEEVRICEQEGAAAIFEHCLPGSQTEIKIQPHMSITHGHTARNRQPS